ncbi:MAG: RNA methyltransferase [Myxococcales bacterium]|nr:RNA methyltransferase [Myxococcales bacterium]
MNQCAKRAIYLALLHFPVYNKHRDVVATAVTNVDIHDICRSARSYGLAGVFFVTPVEQQQVLVREILGHWQHGVGSQQNPFRADAFALAHVSMSLEAAIDQIVLDTGKYPQIVATSAKPLANTKSYREYRRDLKNQPNGTPQLILFGTGWGIVQEVLNNADIRLEPVACANWARNQNADYNHLSVRSAAAIVLDRLLGDGIEDC